MPHAVDEHKTYVVHRSKLASYLAQFPDYYVVSLRGRGTRYSFRLQRKCPWH
jgi:hypothetical protein